MKSQKYLESESLSIVLFVFMFIIYAVAYMTKSMFSAAMATIVEEGFMTKSQTGFITAMFWLVYAPFQIIGGFATDKYSPYKLILIALVGIIISNLIIYLNQSYYVMLAAWMFNAAMQFGLWPGIFKVVSTQTAPQIRGTAVFWLLFSTSLGFGMSMLVASFVSRWQQNFLISVVLCLILLVLYIFLNHFLDNKMVTDELEIVEKTKEPEKQKAAMMPLVLSSGLIVFMLLFLIRTSVDNGIKGLTAVMLMESYDELPAAIATRISSVLIIFSAIGMMITAFVRNKITKNEVKAQIILYSISLIALVVVCFVGKIHYFALLIALSFAVMLTGAAGPFSLSYVSVRYEEYGRIGTVSGIINAFGSIGCVLASYVFARLAEIMSWKNVALIWLMLIVLCLILCMAVLPRWSRFIKEK